jgi:lipoprotein-anchoring transpeptidase ErfK/SrfK
MLQCPPFRKKKEREKSMKMIQMQDKIQQVIGKIPNEFVFVDTTKQQLFVVREGKIDKSYTVSTSSRGTGNREGSFQTPQGVHRVCEKYGAKAPLGRIFRDRVDTGENWPIGLPGENLVLTRILRLEGLEEGINKGPGIDTYERYIYIHGTTNEHRIGQRLSQGCICMKNKDVVGLFELIKEGTIVYID